MFLYSSLLRFPGYYRYLKAHLCNEDNFLCDDAPHCLIGKVNNWRLISTRHCVFLKETPDPVNQETIIAERKKRAFALPLIL